MDAKYIQNKSKKARKMRKMKIAVVGSRGLSLSFDDFEFGEVITELVSGGARGVDRLAAEFARSRGITVKEFLPRYELYGRAAPLKRNEEIVDYADKVYIFWDGKSRGTEFVCTYCKKTGKPFVLKVIDG